MPFRSSDSELPLTPVMFELLLALADGPLHGYAILQAIEPRLARLLPVRTGTLYRALAAALDAGHIAEVTSATESRRRVYRLTPQGRAILKQEAERLADQVRAARSKKLVTGHDR